MDKSMATLKILIKVKTNSYWIKVSTAILMQVRENILFPY